MARELVLPKWAKVIAPGKIEIDADGFYPELLEELDAPEELDQYWLETAFQCAKMDIQLAVAGTEAKPKPGGALVIIVKDNSKESGKWALKNHPKGKGVEAATKGREAREHFKRIRGIEF